MEVEDSERTVLDCLRGRLVAERLASRTAKEEAEQLENKLSEMENLLKEEAKLRMRAEKKLKFLMKKLQSMNIVSDESTSFMDKSDISSSISSSTLSDIPKLKIYTMWEEDQESEEKEKLQQNDQQVGLLSPSYSPNSTTDDSGEEKSFKNQQSFEDSLTSNQSYTDSKMGQQSVEEGLNKECDHNETDNSMALVLVDARPATENDDRIDRKVVDETVREVLDALRRAKEQLQTSMERKRMNMISVG